MLIIVVFLYFILARRPCRIRAVLIQVFDLTFSGFSGKFVIVLMSRGFTEVE
jgi:hypothetical protein